MTEIEKLEAGLEYCYDDPEVEARKENAIIQCKEYNAIDDTDYDAQYAKLKEMLGSVGEKVWIADILGGIIGSGTVPEGVFILHHEEGIDFIPANIELSGLEVTLVNTMSRETVLREYLKTVRDDYDAIILDCMPSLGMLTINALATADSVIILVQSQYLSVRGMEQLIRTISRVKRQINPKLTIEGILITMADMRTNYAKEIVDLLHDTYDGKLRIFKSIIPMSVRAAETSAEGKSIFAHDPAGKVAAAYTAFIEEVSA